MSHFQHLSSTLTHATLRLGVLWDGGTLGSASATLLLTCGSVLLGLFLGRSDGLLPCELTCVLGLGLLFQNIFLGNVTDGTLVLDDLSGTLSGRFDRLSLLELSSVWGGPCNLTWVLPLLGERVAFRVKEEDGLTIDSRESTTVTRVDLEARKAAELEPGGKLRWGEGRTKFIRNPIFLFFPSFLLKAWYTHNGAHLPFI